MKRLTYLYWMSFLSWGLSSCAEEPEDPGLCRLNCNKSIIGPIEAQIQAVQVTQDIVCPANLALSPVPDPLLFQFVVSSPFNTVDNPDDIRQMPLPSVSIEPIALGFRSGLQEHNPNVVINGDTFTPARYKGVVTPASNWCSDSCGVVSMEVVAVCPPSGETSDISVQIHSGALFSEPYTVTVSTADPQ
ncbi:MAG: hypothetical protein ACOH5I_16390 [Oligoflexus sp.]